MKMGVGGEVTVFPSIIKNSPRLRFACGEHNRLGWERLILDKFSFGLIPHIMEREHGYVSPAIHVQANNH